MVKLTLYGEVIFPEKMDLSDILTEAKRQLTNYSSVLIEEFSDTLESDNIIKLIKEIDCYIEEFK